MFYNERIILTPRNRTRKSLVKKGSRGPQGVEGVYLAQKHIQWCL